jgi:hypothetical protein
MISKTDFGAIVRTRELQPRLRPTLVHFDSSGKVRLLKYPYHYACITTLFFAASFYLKKPSRIMGLLMVMGLSLLVYVLAEHVVRTQLAAQDETIPDQLGKPTQTPTMRRVFQMFDGIDLLIVQNGNIRLPQVLNLRPIHQQLLALLGPTIQQFYTPVTYTQSWVT